MIKVNNPLEQETKDIKNTKVFRFYLFIVLN